MNVDTLIIGLISLILGLIATAIKSSMKEYPERSYTGANFLWSSYLLLGCGIFLIIWSFFSG